MELVIVSILFLLIIIGLFIWLKKAYGKKLTVVEDELDFLKKEKEYYNESMMLFSKDNKILFANQAAKNLFSLIKDGDNYVLNTAVQLKTGSDKAIDFFDAIEHNSELSQDSFHLKNSVLTIDGKKKLVNIYIDKSSWNIDNTVTCIIDTDTNIEDKEVKLDGKIDFLTGLPSQFTSLSDINALVIESQKKSESFALFLLGIDHFSNIQSTLGQAYSNGIIKNIANYFNVNPDEKRKVYRLDCDKFLIVVKDVDDETIRSTAKQFIVDIGDYFKGDSHTNLTVSIGIARYPNHGENATKLINHVYIALDRAQKDSIANIEVFTTVRQLIHSDELKMNEEIIYGLKNKEFHLYYQPIFSINGENMVGAEVLIRWDHPTMGLVSPDKFLEVAEKTGLIIDIGEYVFKEAMRQRKEWDELGFNKFKITLNLSLREMQVDELISKISTYFKEYGVDPQDFNLDITEDDAMANIEKTAVDFNMFKELGVSISLDHFGAGYSSLNHLQILPISTLKIDRSIIFDLSSNDDHKITVEGIIGLAHIFGYEVVAEGVETSKEVGILKNLGCDYAQGYLFSRPLPAIEFQELLEK